MRNFRVHGVKGSHSIQDVVTASSVTEATAIFHERHPGYTVYGVTPL